MRKKLCSIFTLMYVETLSHIRVKEAFFFGFIFPLFIYLLFGSIWGSEYQSYKTSLLSGVIAMTIASDSIFGIGPIMRIYRNNNVIKFLRNLPMNIMNYFTGFFLSRLVSLILAIMLLCICAILIFKINISLEMIIVYIIGSILGVTMFAFMSLSISFFSRAEIGRGLLSFVFFVMLFLSGAFLPIFLLPPFLRSVSYVLPLTHLTMFMNGNYSYIWALLGWIATFGMIFYLIFNRQSMKR
ncbi:MAG: ABC transporter permease [Rikenellaceae bacterium]|nr:ABC transporter permease [Rikenellaceae bacterium]